jgi:hypothetical protein
MELRSLLLLLLQLLLLVAVVLLLLQFLLLVGAVLLQLLLVVVVVVVVPPVTIPFLLLSLVGMKGIVLVGKAPQQLPLLLLRVFVMLVVWVFPEQTLQMNLPQAGRQEMVVVQLP